MTLEIWPSPSRVQPWVAAGIVLFAFVVGWFAPWPLRLGLWIFALLWWLWQRQPVPAIRLTKDQAFCYRRNTWQPITIRQSQLGMMYISIKVGRRFYWWRYWRDSLTTDQWHRLSIWVKHGGLEP